MYLDKKLWYFGDSFVADNDGWVRTISEVTKTPIAHLGVKGSSIEYLLWDLHNNLPLVNEHDMVIIAYTRHDRRFFNYKHYWPDQLMNPWMHNPAIDDEDAATKFHNTVYRPGTDLKIQRNEVHLEREWDAYKTYQHQLANKDIDELKIGAIYVYIRNLINFYRTKIEKIIEFNCFPLPDNNIVKHYQDGNSLSEFIKKHYPVDEDFEWLSPNHMGVGSTDLNKQILVHYQDRFSILSRRLSKYVKELKSKI